MDKIKIYYRKEKDTMDIWLGNPTLEVNSEEAGEGLILKKDKDGSYKTSNEYYKKIRIDFEERTDKNLIQVIEELGKEANGSCAELKIIEIPDDIEYEISEYDGAESVHEKHRSWN